MGRREPEDRPEHADEGERGDRVEHAAEAEDPPPKSGVTSHQKCEGDGDDHRERDGGQRDEQVLLAGRDESVDVARHVRPGQPGVGRLVDDGGHEEGHTWTLLLIP